MSCCLLSAAGWRCWWRRWRAVLAVPRDDAAGGAAAAADAAALQPALQEREETPRAAESAHDADRPD